MKVPFSRQNIVTTILVVWAVVSFCYIAWTVFVSYRDGILSQAYNLGVEDAVNQLIKTAQDPKCTTIPISDKANNKRVELINVDCLHAGNVSDSNINTK